MTEIEPPRFARGLIRLFPKSDLASSMLHNIEDEYHEIIYKRGKLAADTWFWIQTLKSLPRLAKSSIQLGGMMVANYLKTAFRNINRHKGFSFINIAGLAIGVACSILIFLYVSYEFSYDKFHKNVDNIYRLCSDVVIGDNNLNIPKTSYRLMNMLKDAYPEIENAAMFSPLTRSVVQYEDKNFYESKIYYATNTVFDIFTFPIVTGDSITPLQPSGTVVITKNISNKFFGTLNPIGKVLKVGDAGEFRVTAVIENLPSNSHFQFDILCSFETLYKSNKSSLDNPMYLNQRGYLLLNETTDYVQLEKKFADFINTNLQDMLNRYSATVKVYLQPLKDIHLKSHLEQEMSRNGDIKYVYIFSAIAVFILLLACINYMNLATARSIKKAKEVGVRKVLGASRGRIAKQFLVESVVFGYLSFLIALLIVALAAPLLSSTIGIQVSFKQILNSWILPLLLTIVMLVGLAAGSYPAFYLSAFSPLRTLKSNIIQSKGTIKLRSALVVFQFSISIILIIATTITLKQLEYMRNTSLGFNKDQILVVPLRDNKVRRSALTLKNELLQHSGIISAGVSSHVPGQTTFKNPFFPEGYDESNPQWMGMWNIDNDYINTMEIELESGRNFSKEFTSDTDLAILINETAAEQFGWDEPLGKTIKMLIDTESQQFFTLEVVGIVKDFHLTSLHSKIEPILITNTTRLGYGALSLRVSPTNLRETIDFIEDKIETIAPGIPFDYFFLDDSFDNQYRNEEQLSRLFSYLTLLAIFIACLGLLGLASFIAENRTKEIGIRKVMGASIPQILVMLTKEFIKWILIANIVAWPVAYYLLEKWLREFAYRINITIDIFVVSGILAFVIVLFTISYQTIKAAAANPIISIKYE